MSVVGTTFEIVGTIFTLYGLVYAWRRSTNRIRDAVDVIVGEIKIRAPAAAARSVAHPPAVHGEMALDPEEAIPVQMEKLAEECRKIWRALAKVNVERPRPGPPPLTSDDARSIAAGTIDERLEHLKKDLDVKAVRDLGIAIFGLILTAIGQIIGLL
jgi:hypothetical protein